MEHVINLMNVIEKRGSKDEEKLVITLWDNPKQFDKHNDLQGFFKGSNAFYYNLALDMYKFGIRVFDNETVLAYVEKDDSLKKQFEIFNGYAFLESFKAKSIDSPSKHIDTYFNEWKKSTIFYNLAKSGYLTEKLYEEVKCQSLVFIKDDLDKRLIAPFANL
jgi:hypothetical protein